MTIGERIREIRRDQNISQTQAILRRGCYRTIVDIERLDDGRE